MKLISFNIWIKIDNSKEIAEFIKSQNPDIVAFQEIIRHFDESVFDMYKSDFQIKQIIWNMFPYSFFWPIWLTDKMMMNGKNHRDFNGFVEQWNEIISKFPISNATNEFYYWNYELKSDWSDFYVNDHSRAILVTELNIDNKQIQIINVHWTYSKDKLDSKRSLAQCEYILKVAKRKNIPTIIVWDFNLFPDTKSIKILSDEFKNLINEYKIISTRPNFNDGMDKWNNIVDYIFVSDKIKVNKFEVIDTDISDHLPLIIDFDILK